MSFPVASTVNDEGTLEIDGPPGGGGAAKVIVIARAVVPAPSWALTVTVPAVVSVKLKLALPELLVVPVPLAGEPPAAVKVIVLPVGPPFARVPMTVTVAPTVAEVGPESVSVAGGGGGVVKVTLVVWLTVPSVADTVTVPGVLALRLTAASPPPAVMADPLERLPAPLTMEKLIGVPSIPVPLLLRLAVIATLVPTVTEPEEAESWRVFAASCRDGAAWTAAAQARTSARRAASASEMCARRSSRIQRRMILLIQNRMATRCGRANWSIG